MPTGPDAFATALSAIPSRHITAAQRMKTGVAPKTCPCGSHREYADCCRPLHEGAPAPDAEALMRSRYSAYAMQLDAYLLASWHPQTRPHTPPRQ